MRIGPTTRFWCVIDATPVSTLGDVCWSATLQGLGHWIIGTSIVYGDPEDENLTIYTLQKEAETDALGRLQSPTFEYVNGNRRKIKR